MHAGQEVSCDDLTMMMLALQRRGCHNINLITPTHYVPQILGAFGAARLQHRRRRPGPPEEQRSTPLVRARTTFRLQTHAQFERDAIVCYSAAVAFFVLTSLFIGFSVLGGIEVPSASSPSPPSWWGCCWSSQASSSPVGRSDHLS